MASKILLLLDPDPQTSVFDSVAAVDAGVEQLFRHGGVAPGQARSGLWLYLHTWWRRPKSTAIFVGGSQVEPAEELLKQVTGTFFGPMRVSVMFDANGCNTTAAAAVIAAGRHVELKARPLWCSPEPVRLDCELVVYWRRLVRR